MIGQIIASLNLEPCGKRGRSNLYRMKPIVQAYAKRSSSSLEAERIRYYKENATKVELANRLRRDEVVEISEVSEFLSSMLAYFRARVLAMPSKLAGTLVGDTDYQRVRNAIETECHTALEELSTYEPSANPSSTVAR